MLTYRGSGSDASSIAAMKRLKLPQLHSSQDLRDRSIKHALDRLGFLPAYLQPLDLVSQS